MSFLARLFSKSPPAAAVSETTVFDLARLLAWDFRNPTEQWFVDTCLRMDINMANAKFAWEAISAARADGNENFFRGALFMAQLAGANAATRSRLAQLMSGK